MRKALTNKQRFEIFKRDGFTCQYCGIGREGKLVVDHIEPVAKGGSNEEGNYITACFQCNIGKGAIPVLPELSINACNTCNRQLMSLALYYFRPVDTVGPIKMHCASCMMRLMLEANYHRGFKTGSEYEKSKR